MQADGVGNYLMKKIGLYGGTFDPIHFGHLNVAFEMIEKRQLNEIWFCPAFINPHKVHTEPSVSPQHRLEMLNLAISDIPFFKANDIEIARQGLSYTYHTIQSLLSENKKQGLSDQFSLIIGEDSVQGFFKWFEPEKIVENVSILVASRSQVIDFSTLQGSHSICKAIKNGWTPIRRMDISATEIRQRLKNGLPCNHLVPYKTLCYIFKNQLYLT